MSVSILILTKSEEKSLPRCLDSVRWSDDVHVLDSSSSDRTLEIAAEYGAKVTRQVGDDRAAQLNAALDHVPFKYPWLLLLEADEQVTKGLEAELALMAFHLGPQVAYRVRRRRFVGGQLLKNGKRDSTELRYFSWDSVRYEGGDQAVAVVDGLVGELEAPIGHHPADQGIARPHLQDESHDSIRPSLQGRNPGRCLLDFARVLFQGLARGNKGQTACVPKLGAFGASRPGGQSPAKRLCL